MKKEKGITLIALIITIILMLILAGVVLSMTLGENGLIKIVQNTVKDYKIAEIKEKNDINSMNNTIIENSKDIKFSCKYLDNQNEKEVKVVFIINDENPIEYVELPNGLKIYGNGKKQIAVDYTVESGKEYSINVKEENSAIKKETVVINYNDIQEYVENDLIEISVITNEEEYNSLKIKEKVENNNFSYFYRTDENQEWVKYIGKNVLSSEQNETPIYIRVVNDITGDILEIHKNIKINNDRLYLYYYGAEFEDVTGGWRLVPHQYNGAAAKNIDNILLYYTGSPYTGSEVHTNNIIELSKYKKLCVKYSKRNSANSIYTELYSCVGRSSNSANGDYFEGFNLNDIKDTQVYFGDGTCYDYIYEVYLIK